MSEWRNRVEFWITIATTVVSLIATIGAWLIYINNELSTLHLITQRNTALMAVVAQAQQEASPAEAAALIDKFINSIECK